MTVCMVISLPEIPYIHRIYMVLANPRHNTSMFSLTLTDPVVGLKA